MNIKQVWKILGKSRASYFLVMACSAVVGGGEALLHPLLIRSIFDAVSQRRDVHEFVILALYYLLLGVSVNILTYLVGLWQSRVDNQIAAGVSSGLLKSFFLRNYESVVREGSGYYVARIRSDVKDGVMPLLSTVRKAAVSVFTLIALVSVLIYISWQAFAILFLIIPISTYVSVLVGKRIRALTTTERDAEADVLRVLTQSINAFKIVNTYALSRRTVSRFSSVLETSLNSTYRKSKAVQLLSVGSDLTMVVSDACSIFVGALLVFAGNITFGSFLAFINAFWRSSTTLISVFSQWAEIHGSAATTERVLEFTSAAERTAPQTVGNEVAGENVSYSYSEQTILSGLSFKFKPGQRVLIVGQNGSGKTTLGNILSGHLCNFGGDLVLPSRVSAITLPLSFPPIPIRDLPVDWEILSKLGVGNVDKLSVNLDLLSAGQQKKLALALALSKDADLYVLDEPLANLDALGREMAIEEIFRVTDGRALVMIMHEPEAYTEMFDVIISLNNSSL